MFGVTRLPTLPMGHALGVRSELAAVGGRLVLRGAGNWRDMPPEPIAYEEEPGCWAVDPRGSRDLVTLAFRKLREAGIVVYRGRRSAVETAVWEVIGG